MCYFSGDYDSTKYSEIELQDTRLLCFSVDHLMPKTYYGKDAKKRSNLKDFKRRYSEKLKRLKSLNLVNAAIWEDERQNQIRALKKSYNYCISVINSYENPVALKKVSVDSSCFVYVDALIIGGEKLFSLWKQLNENHCLSNGDSSSCHKRFLTEFNSPDKLEYAKHYITFYGWQNCNAAHSKGHADNLPNEFQSLFTNLKTHCVE